MKASKFQSFTLLLGLGNLLGCGRFLKARDNRPRGTEVQVYLRRVKLVKSRFLRLDLVRLGYVNLSYLRLG
jgi:hypothetical protein